MSDPHEPPRPDGSDDAPPPPPPSGGYDASAPPPPSDPYGGAAGGGGAYGGGGGGFGAPPDNPYGQPGPSTYSPTDAVSYGWNKFKASPSTLLVPTLVIVVVVIVISVVIRLIVVGGMTDSGSGLGTVLLAVAIASAITSLISQVLAAGLYKGGLSVTDGQTFTFGGLFEGWDKMQVVLAAVIIGVLTLIGTILCYLPALPLPRQPRSHDPVVPAGYRVRHRRRDRLPGRPARGRPRRARRTGLHLPAAPGPAGLRGRLNTLGRTPGSGPGVQLSRSPINPPGPPDDPDDAACSHSSA
jgi:hypothetical protein